MIFISPKFIIPSFSVKHQSLICSLSYPWHRDCSFFRFGNITLRGDRHMKRIRLILKKAFTPVTIMVVPHESLRSINVKIPSLAIFLVLALSGAGTFFLCSLAANGLEVRSLAKQVEYYSQQFSKWKSTVSALSQAEEDFHRIFSLTSKEKILENVDTSHAGSIDLSNLIEDIQKSMEAVDGIKDYLRTRKDIYMATPKGMPVSGSISSPYGKRENPFSGMPGFHTGIDITASPGTPVTATADGVVSYSGWMANSGYAVVLEHGLGFSTAYAHNRKNAVKTGQKVRRGETIAYLGSTGKSTGPHVHYEIWQNGKNVNPQKFYAGRP